MPFPDFDPVLVQIGPFAIRWYALAYVAGILLGWRYVAGLVKNETLWGPRGAPANTAQVDDLILWITLGVIVGGRFTLRPLFRSVARTRSPELFMAACLLVVIATPIWLARSRR